VAASASSTGPPNPARSRATSPGGAASGAVISAAEQAAPQRREVLEDADAEHDGDGGRQVDRELVAEPDEAGGDDGVAHERQHEDPVVERVLDVRPHAPERRVDGGDDAHGDVARHVRRHRRAQDEGDERAGDQAEEGEHRYRTPAGVAAEIETRPV
jgi:hypothetical protein